MALIAAAFAAAMLAGRPSVVYPSNVHLENLAGMRDDLTAPESLRCSSRAVRHWHGA
jgi:hypothetical protein